MEKTFKDLMVNEIFVTPNRDQIISNRGDLITPWQWSSVSWNWSSSIIRFKKRDELGATSFYESGYETGAGNWRDGCYYRIESDNIVFTS